MTQKPGLFFTVRIHEFADRQTQVPADTDQVQFME
jgi:hypothetical protein